MLSGQELCGAHRNVCHISIKLPPRPNRTWLCSYCLVSQELAKGSSELTSLLFPPPDFPQQKVTLLVPADGEARPPASFPSSHEMRTLPAAHLGLSGLSESAAGGHPASRWPFDGELGLNLHPQSGNKGNPLTGSVTAVKAMPGELLTAARFHIRRSTDVTQRTRLLLQATLALS